MAIYRLGKKVFWGVLSSIFMLLAFSLLAVYYLEIASKDVFREVLQPAPSPRSAKNATYLEHAWVEKDMPKEKIQELATLLQEAQITDVFVHTGPFEADGTIPASRYPNAQKFLATLRSHAPRLRVQAWLGQVRTVWGGVLTLDEATRKNITQTSITIADLGFDGIHINIEPIFNNDTEVLTLMQELYPVLHEKKKILSLATDDVEPFPWGRVLVKLYSPDITMWDGNFFRTMQKYTDQLVIMSYDSGFTKTQYYSLYVSLLAQSFRSTPEDTVFIGIPTYEKPGKKFHPEIENMRTGLAGMIDAASHLSKDQVPGIALYAWWETDKKEWEEYFSFWLGKKWDDRLTIN